MHTNNNKIVFFLYLKSDLLDAGDNKTEIV